MPKHNINHIYNNVIETNNIPCSIRGYSHFLNPKHTIMNLNTCYGHCHERSLNFRIPIALRHVYFTYYYSARMNFHSFHPNPHLFSHLSTKEPARTSHLQDSSIFIYWILQFGG
jgi:hypothetical protein